MPEQRRQHAQSQDPDAPPIENPERRRLMDSGKVPRRRIDGELRLMDSSPAEQGQPATGDQVMSAFDPTAAQVALDASAGVPQEPAGGQEAPANPDSEGYIRLQMRFDGTALNVLWAREVAGPLVRPSGVSNGFLYEVAIRERQVSVGAIADLGVHRSYPRPPGQGGTPGHHITLDPTYEFAVRVPRQSLTLQALRRTRVVLYRVNTTVLIPPPGNALLSVAPTGALTPLARLDGISPDDLPDATRQSLLSTLRS